jgi:hypothetical protein
VHSCECSSVLSLYMALAVSVALFIFGTFIEFCLPICVLHGPSLLDDLLKLCACAKMLAKIEGLGFIYITIN